MSNEQSENQFESQSQLQTESQSQQPNVINTQSSHINLTRGAQRRLFVPETVQSKYSTKSSPHTVYHTPIPEQKRQQQELQELAEQDELLMKQHKKNQQKLQKLRLSLSQQSNQEDEEEGDDVSEHDDFEGSNEPIPEHYFEPPPQLPAQGEPAIIQIRSSIPQIKASKDKYDLSFEMEYKIFKLTVENMGVRHYKQYLDCHQMACVPNSRAYNHLQSAMIDDKSLRLQQRAQQDWTKYEVLYNYVVEFMRKRLIPNDTNRKRLVLKRFQDLHQGEQDYQDFEETYLQVRKEMIECHLLDNKARQLKTRG